MTKSIEHGGLSGTSRREDDRNRASRKRPCLAGFRRSSSKSAWARNSDESRPEPRPPTHHDVFVVGTATESAIPWRAPQRSRRERNYFEGARTASSKATLKGPRPRGDCDFSFVRKVNFLLSPHSRTTTPQHLQTITHAVPLSNLETTSAIYTPVPGNISGKPSKA
jgi:hypothetical protein